MRTKSGGMGVQNRPIFRGRPLCTTPKCMTQFKTRCNFLGCVCAKGRRSRVSKRSTELLFYGIRLECFLEKSLFIDVFGTLSLSPSQGDGYTSSYYK